jgi:hypothetical protein
MNYMGLLVGLFTFIIIGIFHPIVIKGEYYFGKGVWPIFFIAGGLSIIGSLMTEDHIIASVLAVLAFTLFWSIRELFDQEKRVNKGWFPKNPNRS